MDCAEMHSDIGPLEIYSKFSHDQWLELRHSDVTASAVGALFDCHPYLTPLGLYAQKIQLNPPASIDNGVLRRGRWFEAAAIKAAKETKPDWKIEEPGIYVRDAAHAIGCTPDASFVDENGECGALQIKTVGKQKWKEEWVDGDAINVPFWIVLQAYVEARLMNFTKAAVAALVCDEYAPELHIVEFNCPQTTYARIAKEVGRFWDLVEARTPPAADYSKDAGALAQLYTGAGPAVDLSGDEAFRKLLDEREAILARRNQAIEDAEQSRARIIAAMKNAEAVVCDNRIVSFREQTRKAHTVGEATFRTLRISARKVSRS
jgi:predicted phage-related endonuclease